MKTAEEIPSETVTKMQKEFQPRTETSFEQGMYSGYAFGLQDGFKYAMDQYRTEGLRDELIKYVMKSLKLNKDESFIAEADVDEYLKQKGLPL